MNTLIEITVDYKDLNKELYENLNKLTCGYKLHIVNVPEHKIEFFQNLLKNNLFANQVNQKLLQKLRATHYIKSIEL